MTELTIYADSSSTPVERHTQEAAIANALAPIQVKFERWPAGRTAEGATPEEVLRAYGPEIERINTDYGFRSVDVVSLAPDNPKKHDARKMFLDEHTHADFEVRFFVQGSGQFYLHAGGRVYQLRCVAGDLISVPAGIRHWFDMGPNPSFQAIRFFTTPEGWKATFTGDAIAGRFPKYE
jgi:1,2-dihydroxy-3-keto-5-methylthiopentene dioxygenase